MSSNASAARLVEHQDLGEAWRKRFAFFAAHGSPYARAGVKALEGKSRDEQIQIVFNPWAFFLGIIYFFYLGIPKRGFGLMALGIIVALIVSRLTGEFVNRWTGAIVELMFGLTANYYRYIKVATGRDELNPFTDIRGSL